MSRVEAVIKRTMDITMALILVILLSPLLLLLSALIVMDSRGGAIYKQKRPGKNGALFYLYKFRSMVPGAENMGAGYYFAGPEDPRITKVGRMMRNTSLDELPQLFNVLKGEMSIIGPRPALPYQVELYNQEQRKRLLVKPGITGWAQVNGRNDLSWSKKIAYDIWYIEHYSLGLDIKILCQTVKVVLKGSGIRYDVTPEETEDFSNRIGVDNRAEPGALSGTQKRGSKEGIQSADGAEQNNTSTGH